MKKEVRGRTRVLIADAQPIVLEGYKALLNQQPEVELVGEARTEEELVRLAEKLCPEIILLDIAMPPTRGMDVLQDLRKKFLRQRSWFLRCNPAGNRSPSASALARAAICSKKHLSANS